MSIDWGFLKAVGAIAALMLANTAFAVAKASKEGTFDWNELLQGLKKYGIVLIGVAFIYLAGQLTPEFTFDLLDSEVVIEHKSIMEALNIFAGVIEGIYAVKAFMHLIEIFGIKKTVAEVIESTEEIVG